MVKKKKNQRNTLKERILETQITVTHSSGRVLTLSLGNREEISPQEDPTFDNAATFSTNIYNLTKAELFALIPEFPSIFS